MEDGMVGMETMEKTHQYIQTHTHTVYAHITVT